MSAPASVPDSVAPASVGVVIVGLVLNTATPVPVSSVRAAKRFAEDGVARKVSTPVPAPVREAIGKAVQLARLPEAGVPSTGVTKVGLVNVPFVTVGVVSVGVVRVGLVLKTRTPVPVSSVTAARRLALEGVVRNVDTFVPRSAVSYLDAIATAMAVNSASISVPLTTFEGLPLRRASLAVKLVILL